MSHSQTARNSVLSKRKKLRHRPACTYMGFDARKPVFGGLLTAKAQTSLHVFAFVISFLVSIKIKTCYERNLTILRLVSVAKKTGFG